MRPNAQIWVFWVKKYHLSNLISEISHVLYFECADFKSDIGFWKFWTQIPILVKKYQLSNLNEIFRVCCFAGADFKSDICFQKFLAQIPKFKNFGPKSIKPFNLNDSLSVRYFEGADFKSDICFQKFPVQIHKSLILRNLACMLFWRCWFQTWDSIFVVLSSLDGKLTWKIIFRFFAKVSQCYGLNCYFLKVLIVNIRKKCKLILSHNNFKISRNRMNGKTDFEIILKRCKHMKHVTARTISIITISMVTNQNLFIMFMPINKYLLRYF